MSMHTRRRATTALRAGSAFALAIAAMGGLATTSQAATSSSQAAMTVSPTVGNEAGGQSITATSTTNKFYSGKVYVQFQTTTALTGNCATTYTATAANSIINATSTSIISSKKISIKVPVLTGATVGATQLWLVCSYNGNSAGTSTLLAKGSYTTAGAPTVTALTADYKIPTYGGPISVVGTGFVSGLTATLGGQALTDVNVVDATLFTATAPAHTAGDVALTVTTVGGSATVLSSATNAFTYVSALSISPTTGVSGSTTPVTLAIQGTGFNDISWGDTAGTAVAGAGDVPGKGPDSNGAHIYLLHMSKAGTGVGAPAISGGVPQYVGTAFNAGTGTNKTAAEAGECQNVAVISDTELTCSIDLANGYVTWTGANTQLAQSTGADVATGVYTVALVDDGDAAAYTYALGNTTSLSSTNVFVVAPF